MKYNNSTKPRDMIEGARRFLQKFTEKNLDNTYSEVNSGRLTREDVDAISMPQERLTREDVNKISLKEEKKAEIKEMPLNSKLTILTEKQWTQLVERIVDELEEEEFLYQVREGYYNNEPELKERLVKGFLDKKAQNKPTRARPSSTSRRMR